MRAPGGHGRLVPHARRRAVDPPRYLKHETVGLLVTVPSSYVRNRRTNDLPGDRPDGSRGQRIGPRPADADADHARRRASLAPSLVDGGAGSSTGDVLAVEQATKKVNQLLNLRQQDTTKADAAPEGKPAAKKADTEAPKQGQDNGNGKPSDVSPQGAAPAGPASTEPGNGNGQGPATAMATARRQRERQRPGTGRTARPTVPGTGRRTSRTRSSRSSTRSPRCSPERRTSRGRRSVNPG